MIYFPGGNMAVITNLQKIRNFQLGDAVAAYLDELVNADSAAVKRIFALEAPSFVRHDITDNIFAIEQSFFTKDRENCFFESHRKFADIQIVLKGRERIELMNINDLSIDESYDAGKDLVTYKIGDTGHHLNMLGGSAAVFYPEDAHMCVVRAGAPERVYKTVLKVPVDMLK